MWWSAFRGIMILTLSLLAVPLTAETQPPTKVHRIGWLSAGAPHADLERG